MVAGNLFKDKVKRYGLIPIPLF